jgi:DNA-binding MarR family transcriptional regulator
MLPVALLVASRALFDELHARLARTGHPDLRPAHGFALQAVGSGGTTSSELAIHLGITKQGAGQMVDELVRLGYVERRGGLADRRRKALILTDQGHEVLRHSAELLEALRAEWADRVGDERLQAMEVDLGAAAELFGDSGRPGLRPVW